MKQYMANRKVLVESKRCKSDLIKETNIRTQHDLSFKILQHTLMHILLQLRVTINTRCHSIIHIFHAWYLECLSGGVMKSENSQ